MEIISADILSPYIGILVFFHLLFLWAYFQKDVSVVDVGWGPGFIVYASICIFYSKEVMNQVDRILFVLIFLWATRLGLYLFLRNRKKGEDARYQDMKKNWGERPFLQAYFKVFILQSVLMYLSGLSILFITSTTQEPEAGILHLVFGLICLFAVVYEGIADNQKNEFKKHSPNKFCNVGLYKYSRYPNYFGEILFWWSLSLLGLGHVDFWKLLIAPTFLTVLIIKVSGIPLLEKRYANNDEYQEYKRKTNALIPWFPKE